MQKVIVDSREPLTLLGGGAVGTDDLETARAVAPNVVAADGGATVAVAQGIALEAVIGDLDSIDADARAAVPEHKIYEIPEQNSTDFDKVIRSVRAPLIVGVGFLGKRIDHQLAALNRLAAWPDRHILLLGSEDIVLHGPPSLKIDVAADTRVSLFPLTQTQGRSQGLFWPIDGIAMAPNRAIGTSNHSTGSVSLEMASPGMLVILPRAAFGATVAALMSVAPWPARATE